MTIWNPLVFTPLGQPVGAVAPPTLRVYGPMATAAQVAMAQTAFHNFTSMARLSAVPNPTAIGALPDGTRYRIFVVGNQSIMEIWPAPSSGDDLRKSGVALALVALDGSLIPSLSNDGAPIGYLLTPEVVNKTRQASGKWRVRDPKPLNGGKAVNANAKGAAYFAGVEGNLNTQIPFQRNTMYSVNGLAYDDDLSGTEPVWQSLKKVGKSRGEPLPFLYESGDVKHAMQIIVRLEALPTPTYFLDLYVGPAKGDVDEFIGELVHSEELPDGRALDYRSITYKGDGTTARATGTDDGQFAFFTIDITPTGLSVTLDRRVPQSNTTGSLYYDTSQDIISGTPGSPGYSVQTTRIFGSGDGPSFGARFSVDEPGAYMGPGSFYGWGDLDMVQYGADANKFDRRGEPVDGATTRRGVTMTSYSEQILSQSLSTPPDPGTQLYRVTEARVDNSRRTDTSYGSGGSKVLLNQSDALNTELTYILDRLGQVVPDSEVRTVSGSGFSIIDEGGGHALLLNDTDLDFQIFYNRVESTSQTWDWVLVPPSGFGKQYTSNTTTTSDTLRVVCQGQEILARAVDFNEPFRHLIFLASDPMTGALVVNLQEAHIETRAPRASWIFVVDDTGCRNLSDIMRLPAGQDVKVRNNASLFSV